MDVESFEPPFRFHVVSSSRGSSGLRHLVDLVENDFVGACSCEHFTMTLIREVRAGKIARCRHIEVARKHWLDWMLKRVKTELDNQ